MKKAIFALALTACFGLTMTSCSKETTCECTTTVQGIDPVTTVQTYDENVDCSDFNSTSTAGGFTSTFECVEQ